MQITIWNEYIHEQQDTKVAAVYPQGIHVALRELLAARMDDVQIVTATLEQPQHGLSAEVLQHTDVLFWWGHLAHHRVDDEVVQRVYERVMQGMGLIVLHSAHLSKIFTRLMGTTCNLRWREADDRELVWTVNPTHAISRGVRQPIEIPEHEMYGEFFDIPQPDELVFVIAFAGGEVCRSGCCFNRGKGRVFYCSPGHETYPVYYQDEIGQVLTNAAHCVYRPQVSPIENQRSPNAEKDWWV